MLAIIFFIVYGDNRRPKMTHGHQIAVVSTCNILAEYVVAGYGLISLPSTVKAILS